MADFVPALKFDDQETGRRFESYSGILIEAPPQEGFLLDKGGRPKAKYTRLRWVMSWSERGQTL